MQCGSVIYLIVNRRYVIMKIKVVDDSMGSFKSSSAMKMIHESDESKNWVVITPYLDEIRIFKDPTKPEFKRGFLNLKKTRKLSEPKNLGWGKLKSLKELMVSKSDIATTHALFKYADEELVSLIKANDYTLVLDEVMDVIQPIRIKKVDIDKFIEDGIINIDEFGVVSVNEGVTYYKRYEDVITTIRTGRVVSTGESFLLWCFPIDVLEAFKDIYILTYLFEGSLMKAYMDTFGIEYRYYSVDKKTYTFKDYEEPNISKYKDKITIVDTKNVNSVGDSRTDLSFSWYGNIKHDKLIGVLRNNIYNYYRNIVGCRSKDFMWTTFKDYKGDLQSNGYRSSKTFCPHNARAVNTYADRTVLAYTVNRFINPTLVKWFKFKGIDVDQDLYATSEFVQWVFRSAIRNDKPITLYCPSRRMRELFINWLECK